MMNPPESLMLHCNACGGRRKHTILHEATKSYYESDDDDQPSYEEHNKYQLAECAGCEDISLHIEHWSSALPDPHTTQWPPKTLRGKPKWLTELVFQEIFESPFKSEFLNEIYLALGNDNLRLAVIGIRALLEQVMIESVGDKKTFKENMDAFHQAGYISKLQREAIEPVIEAGHASMHRGFKASRVDVEALLDVVENIIESIYISKSKVARIKVPQRKT